MEHPLRIKRTAASLSVEALAERAGVAKSTISRVETGQADPSLELIRRLCLILPELRADDFLAPHRPVVAAE